MCKCSKHSTDLVLLACMSATAHRELGRHSLTCYFHACVRAQVHTRTHTHIYTHTHAYCTQTFQCCKSSRCAHACVANASLLYFQCLRSIRKFFVCVCACAHVYVCASVCACVCPHAGRKSSRCSAGACVWQSGHPHGEQEHQLHQRVYVWVRLLRLLKRQGERFVCKANRADFVMLSKEHQFTPTCVRLGVAFAPSQKAR